MHGVHGAAGLDTAVDPVVGQCPVAQHRLATADAQEQVDHRRQGGARPQHHVGVVGLEQKDPAGVELDHALGPVEHQRQDLLHRLSGGLLDELAHDRVAGGLLLAHRHRVCGDQLRAGAAAESHGQAAVVVREPAGLVAQQDEAAHLVADGEGHRQETLDRHLVRYVGDELEQTHLVGADEVLAGLHGRDQGAGGIAAAGDGLRMETVKADARRLRHELAAVGRHEVAASEAGAEVVGEQGGQRGRVGGRARALGVLRGGHEGALLVLELRVEVLHLLQAAAQGVCEAAVGGDAHEAAEGEQHDAGQLERQPPGGEVEVDRQQDHQQRAPRHRTRDRPLRVGGPGDDGHEARDRGHDRVAAGAAGRVQRPAGQDQHGGRRRERDPDQEGGSLGTDHPDCELNTNKPSGGLS